MSYESAGTVEFIYDVVREDFYFLEVNTRLQVEHPVTEQVYGVDLVEWMVRQAAGEDVLGNAGALVPKGAAIEVRLYAENPGAAFAECRASDLGHLFAGCADRRWIETGTEVSSFYDPMLAKIIVSAETRDAAIAKLTQALDETVVAGIESNLDYLRAIAASTCSRRAGRDQRARWLRLSAPHHRRRRAGCAERSPGIARPPASRHVGVPPSGPMDDALFVSPTASSVIPRRRPRWS